MRTKTKEKSAGEQLERYERMVVDVVDRGFGVRFTPAAFATLDDDEAADLLALAEKIDAAGRGTLDPERHAVYDMTDSGREFLGKIESARARAPKSSYVQRDADMMTQFVHQYGVPPDAKQLAAIGEAAKAGTGHISGVSGIRTTHITSRERTIATLGEEDLLRLTGLVEKMMGLQPGHFEYQRELAKMMKEIAAMTVKPAVIPPEIIHGLNHGDYTASDLEMFTGVVVMFASKDDQGPFSRYTVDDDGETIRLRSTGSPGWKSSADTPAVFPAANSELHPLRRLAFKGWVEVTYEQSGSSRSIWIIRKGYRLLDFEAGRKPRPMPKRKPPELGPNQAWARV